VKKTLLWLLLLFPCAVSAQNYRYDNIVLGPRGPVPAASVAVCTQPANTSMLPCSPLATIFSTAGGASQANPLTTDALGNYHFYAASGLYTIQIYGPQVSSAVVMTDVSIGGSVLTGSNTFTGPNTFTGGVTATSGQNTANFYNIDGILYVDGNKYANLAAAVSACPSTGCIIQDNFPETFSADPMVGSSGKSIDVWFGAGVWTTNAQINVLSAQRWIGTGRIVGSTGATIIRAGGSLSANTPLIKLAGTQGTRVENLNVDCNGVSGSTGIYASDLNEQGGVYNTVVVNCPAFGINVDASAFSVIPAQGYTIRDVEIFPQTFGTASTIGLHLKGNGGGGPQEVRNVVASGASGHVIRSSVQAENWNGSRIESIHGEFATNVFENTSSSISAFILDFVSGTTTDTNVVNINAASGAVDFEIRNIVTNGGGTNSIVDGPRGVTLRDPFLARYTAGSGSIGQEDIYTTSPNVTKHLVGTTSLDKLFLCPTCSPPGVTINNILAFSTGNITPTAVTANTCSDQTFTVSGLVQASDSVTSQVKWPGALGNVTVTAIVSANNTILLHFCNASTASVTPPAGKYLFWIFR
jgi:hypothetical protein